MGRSGSGLRRRSAASSPPTPDTDRRWSPHGLAGDDTGPDGEPIAGAAAWQPRLWRLLHEQIGTPAVFETLPGALASLRSGAAGVGLPDRISVYGVTAFDPVELAVFEAIGDVTDVHLFVLHPSPALWKDTAPLVAAIPESTLRVRRSDDPSRGVAQHPLLRSWAQESRELQVVLGSGGGLPEDMRVSGDVDADTLLGALQG